jgi:hypothetical protein
MLIQNVIADLLIFVAADECHGCIPNSILAGKGNLVRIRTGQDCAIRFGMP